MFEGPVAEEVDVGAVEDVLDKTEFLGSGQGAVALDLVEDGVVEVQLVRGHPVGEGSDVFFHSAFEFVRGKDGRSELNLQGFEKNVRKKV